MKTIIQPNQDGPGHLIHLLGKVQIADLINLRKNSPYETNEEEGIIINASDPAAQFWAVQFYQGHCAWIALYRPETHRALIVWVNEKTKKLLDEEIDVALTCVGSKSEPCGKRVRLGANWPYCRNHRQSNPLRQGK